MMVYVVLGMHKSGTSWLAEKLWEAGIAMTDYAPCDAEFEYRFGGKFERLSTKNINEYLLNCKNVHSILIKNKIYEGRERKAEELMSSVVKSNDHITWGFKDPRTLFTYQKWKGVIGDDNMTAVGIFRSPVAVAARYGRNNPIKFIRALKMWRAMNALLLEVCTQEGITVLDFDKVRRGEGESEIILKELEVNLDYSAISATTRRWRWNIFYRLVDSLIMNGECAEIHRRLMAQSL